MKISYNWLQNYFEDKLPSPYDLADVLNDKAFEIEGVEDSRNDFILNASILPNRSHDLLSYIGLAKETAVLLDKSLNLPVVSYPKNSLKKTSDFISLEVENNSLVPRAMKRVVLNVEVKESPDWLKEKLASIGQRSINNIVDITNFVMWETGQPVHAFDLNKIKDGKILIRGAKGDEKIKILDGSEFELKEGMLVISDPEKALDIAGIKGGFSSGIDENTKNIVLSVCNFNPTQIRRTSRTLGLRTDASQRFENAISPYLAEVAMDRLSQLVSEFSGGEVLEEILDIYPKEKVRTTAPYKIGVSLTDINKVLGSNIEEDEVENILNRFSKYAGFGWQKIKPIEKVLENIEQYVGVPYKYGSSVTFDSPNYFDCSSFVNYVYVNAGINLPRRTVDQFVYGESVSEFDLKPGDVVFSLTPKGEAKIERLNSSQNTVYAESIDFMKGTKVSELSHNGIYLGNGKIIHASGKWHKGQVVVEELKETPAFKEIVGFKRLVLSEEEKYLVEIPKERLDLRAGPGYLISGIKEDLIEEIGRVYGYSKIQSKLPEIFKSKPNKIFYHTEKLRDLLVSKGFTEVMTYSFQEKGEVKLANPLASDKKYLRANLYQGLSKALELNKNNAPLLGGSNVYFFEIGKVFNNGSEKLSLGVATNDKKYLFDEIIKDVTSIAGEVKSEQKDSILLIEINEENLKEVDSYRNLNKNLSTNTKFNSISTYPFVLRDIALWVPDNKEEQEVEDFIKSYATDLLFRIGLFDKYEKDGRTSYAFNLVFQSKEKTLSDEEVNRIMDNIYNQAKEVGFEIR
jgi:phenylalanyl-tRNA synthetase beta subunit